MCPRIAGQSESNMTSSPPPSTRVSIVVPTFNEAANVAILVQKLEKTLQAYDWEVIFVDDDSTDLTWKRVKDIAARDPRVRCLRRVGRRGLAGACIEGILSSSSPVAVVMDGDLQHDESILPVMIEKILQENNDVVVGSRYVEGGSNGGGFSRRRAAMSRFATTLAHRITGDQVSDVMSGFFAVRRDRFEAMAGQISTAGFKILLDILMTGGPTLRVSEVEYTFRAREDGASKFDLKAMWDFVVLLLAKSTRGIINERLIYFLMVGVIGLGVNLFVLRILIGVPQLDFAISQTIATFLAMTSNFYINNSLTYRDKKLKGFAFVRGLVFFYLICSAGAVSNIGISSWMFSNHQEWWVAGIVGAIIGSVWNYAVSSILVWNR